MLRSVGFLPAYRAAGRAALRVVALLALPGGRLPDPVSPLGRDGPVAGSQLVDVDRGLPVSSGDGRGRRAPISRRYHPAGQAWMVRVRASLAAARCAVLTSTVAVVWSRELASLAIESARSLPLRPQWEGTHCRTIWRLPSDSPLSVLQVSMPNGELWAAGPSRSEAKADWESVHTTMGSSTCAGFFRRWLRAEWRASISARKLEQMLPAGVRTSSSPPSGHSMSAPAPPFVTPSVADPSVHT